MANETISGTNEVGITIQQLRADCARHESVLSPASYEASAIGSDLSGAVRKTLSVQPKSPERRAARSAAPEKKPRPEDRDALRRYWQFARTSAASMDQAAQSGDYIELCNAAHDLMGVLDDMWRMRDAREDDWRGSLNFLQGVLKEVEFENLRPEHCSAIKTIVTDFLGPATVDKEDVRTCLRLLRGAGLDPWRPISGEPEEG